MSTAAGARQPAFPFITLADDGHPKLVGQRCTDCGATYADSTRVACGRCGAREDKLELFEPALEGSLHSAVIVHRGYPGVPTPFISAVVDLDGGPTVKGTLRGVPFEPAAITFGRRVRVSFDDALGRTDKLGNAYVSHFFEPVEG